LPSGLATASVELLPASTVGGVSGLSRPASSAAYWRMFRLQLVA
jgi:hypothetical protein